MHLRIQKLTHITSELSEFGKGTGNSVGLDVDQKVSSFQCFWFPLHAQAHATFVCRK